MKLWSVENPRQVRLTSAALTPLGLSEIQPGYVWTLPIGAKTDEGEPFDWSAVSEVEFMVQLPMRVIQCSMERGVTRSAKHGGVLYLRLSAEETNRMTQGEYPFVVRYRERGEWTVLFEGTVGVTGRPWHIGGEG